MSLTKLSMGGNNDVIYKLFPRSESLVSDIPAGDGNIEKLFLLCKIAIVLLLFLQNNVDGFRLACWSFWYWTGGIGGRVRLSSGRPGSSSNFSEQIKGTISCEEHKTIYCGLRISGIALSNQRELQAFFSPRQVDLKISHSILRNPTIPDSDLPRMA